MVKHWLMKAEPDSRIVKGKDVKVPAGATFIRSLFAVMSAHDTWPPVLRR